MRAFCVLRSVLVAVALEQLVGDVQADTAHTHALKVRTRMPSRRRRLPEISSVAVSAMRRKALRTLGGLFLVLQTPLSQAGRVEISWLHDVHDELAPSATVMDGAGDVIVCGCKIHDANSFYVTKLSALGEQIWRREFASDEGPSCATAVVSDAALNVYVTGTVVATSDDAEDDVDVFVARLSPSGSLVWRRTLGTSYRDVSTSIRVVETVAELPETSIVLGGYSGGSIAQGKDSSPNCKGGLAYGEDASLCDAGFVAKLTAATGSVEWIQTVASVDAGDTRVFDVAVDTASETPALMVVGETRGDLRHQLATGSTERHAGDVFVRRLDLASGEMLWTTQLGSAASADVCQIPASSASASSYTRYYPRGRCAVVLHPQSQELSIVATTFGLVSTFPSQKQQYPAVCAKGPSRPCMQLFVARLKADTGSVQWVRQLIHAASTSAESAVALTSDDVVVLGTASAGFFPTTESMEQLLVLRLAPDGVVQWTRELGLDGEDHATGVVAREVGTDSELFVLSHGSVDKARRGQPSTQSDVRRIQTGDGHPVSVCIDLVAFDKTQSINITRANGSTVNVNSTTALQVQLPVRRDPTRLCPDTAASVDYLFSFESSTSLATTNSTGRVHFASGQSTASLVVVVPAKTSLSSTLHISLQSIASDSQVDSHSAQWSVGLDEDASTSQGLAAADGRLWRQLTWLTLVGAAVMTVLVVVVGRFGWVGVACSWRKAKVFQYKTLRLRQSSSPPSPLKTRAPSAATPIKSKASARPKTPSLTGSLVSEPPQQRDEDETDELRSHLEEIQQLNQSLGGLLQQHAQSSAPATSPRSSATRLPSIADENLSPGGKAKKGGWRRSVHDKLR